MTFLVPEPNEDGIEEFDVNTDKALITLATSLDYEVADLYLLKIVVVDINASPPQTGSIVVQVLKVEWISFVHIPLSN